MKFSDLSPADQKAIRSGNVTRPAARKPRVSTKGDPQWECYACGYRATSFKDAERHADAEHHARIESCRWLPA